MDPWCKKFNDCLWGALITHINFMVHNSKHKIPRKHSRELINWALEGYANSTGDKPGKGGQCRDNNELLLLHRNILFIWNTKLNHFKIAVKEDSLLRSFLALCKQSSAIAKQGFSLHFTLKLHNLRHNCRNDAKNECRRKRLHFQTPLCENTKWSSLISDPGKNRWKSVCLWCVNKSGGKRLIKRLWPNVKKNIYLFKPCHLCTPLVYSNLSATELSVGVVLLLSYWWNFETVPC